MKVFRRHVFSPVNQPRNPEEQANLNEKDGRRIAGVDFMRFACQKGCTKCCARGGFVYLTESDLKRAADYLGMTPAEFENRYVIRYGRVLRLRRPPRGQDHCQFLTPHGCSIHSVKPTQCRTYPFWPSLVESRAIWAIEGNFCPGIGKGALVQIKTARQIASELPRAFPTLNGFWNRFSTSLRASGFCAAVQRIRFSHGHDVRAARKWNTLHRHCYSPVLGRTEEARRWLSTTVEEQLSICLRFTSKDVNRCGNVSLVTNRKMANRWLMFAVVLGTSRSGTLGIRTQSHLGQINRVYFGFVIEMMRHPKSYFCQLCTKVAETAPPSHGQVDSAWKAARLINDVEVMVPPFVKSGDTIRLSLSDMKYMERAKAKSS
jgi:Fe-S-cluster containining protein